MRRLVVPVVLSLALFTTWAKNPFDDKTDALAEIKAKYEEVEGMGKRTLEAAFKEKSGIDMKGEKELLKLMSLKINETRIQFDKDVREFIRQAIVKSKPMAVVHCIRNVSSTGNMVIDNENNSFREKVIQIRLNKTEKIDFDISDIEAILAGLKDLVEEAKKNINNGGAIPTIKTEALKNCQSAESLLGDIEVNLHEPILNKEYTKMRQKIDNSLRNVKERLNSELKKCLETQS